MITGVELKNLRRKASLTQEELAERVGVSRSAVYKWERGACLPDGENLIKLAQVLGVTVSYLVGEFDLNDERFKNMPLPLPGVAYIRQLEQQEKEEKERRADGTRTALQTIQDLDDELGGGINIHFQLGGRNEFSEDEYENIKKILRAAREVSMEDGKNGIIDLDIYMATRDREKARMKDGETI